MRGRKWPPPGREDAAHTEADDHRGNQDDLVGPKAPRRSLMNFHNSTSREIWCGCCRDGDVPALSRMKLVILGPGVGVICGAAGRSGAQRGLESCRFIIRYVRYIPPTPERRELIPSQIPLYLRAQDSRPVSDRELS